MCDQADWPVNGALSRRNRLPHERQNYAALALEVGVRIGIAEIRADEFFATLILEEERDRLERERLAGDPRI